MPKITDMSAFLMGVGFFVFSTLLLLANLRTFGTEKIFPLIAFFGASVGLILLGFMSQTSQIADEEKEPRDEKLASPQPADEVNEPEVENVSPPDPPLTEDESTLPPKKQPEAVPTA